MDTMISYTDAYLFLAKEVNLGYLVDSTSGSHLSSQKHTMDPLPVEH